MGTLHNELRRGPYSRALKDFLGIQDTEAGVERFGETLTPIVDIWTLDETYLLRDEILYARAALTAAAPAGRFPAMQLVNPNDSGVIAVVDLIASTCEVAIEQGDTFVIANPVAFQGVALDSRFKQLGETSVLRGQHGDVAAGAALAQYRDISANPGWNPRITMGPNSKLFLIGTTAAATLRFSLRWRERKANPQELT